MIRSAFHVLAMVFFVFGCCSALDIKLFEVVQIGKVSQLDALLVGVLTSMVVAPIARC